VFASRLDCVCVTVGTNPQTAYRKHYDAEGSRRYQHRKPAKHRAELRLIDRAFALIPKRHRVLDIPCGGGRLMIHLAKEGFDVTGADVSEGMLQIAREAVAEAGLRCRVEPQDLESLTYRDRAFDTVVCFRLFHHFPSPQIRRRVVNELCRVAGQYVVLSYFSAASLTSWKHNLAGKWGGRKRSRYPVARAEVEGYFRACGYRLLKDFAQLPFVHTLHLAVFERVG
jgi:cyclopropane fatty-acyl-phospholipid synthase-like methyltransferase